MLTEADGLPVKISNRGGASGILLVCEHASNALPRALGDMGLSKDQLQSHIAWDPGAGSVASLLSEILDAPLVSANFSRLAYDVNRPPESSGAIRQSSEGHIVPGNGNLSEKDRQQRVSSFYTPFHSALAGLLEDCKSASPVLITVHSFTPIYFGKHRATELGILHDVDARLADRMINLAPLQSRLKVSRNEPYGPQDGVTHTLAKHALPRGFLNAMLEIRNDLIATTAQQAEIAEQLAGLIRTSLSELEECDAA